MDDDNMLTMEDLVNDAFAKLPNFIRKHGSDPDVILANTGFIRAKNWDPLKNDFFEGGIKAGDTVHIRLNEPIQCEDGNKKDD